jgi:hypothetical protein
MKALLIGSLCLVTTLGWTQENNLGRKPQDANTGLWRGIYVYPQDVAPVKFNMLTIQEGSTVVGFIKEPNTFGQTGQPWLHALIKGSIDPQTGAMTYTKTYDGTAGQSHDVAYGAKSVADGKAYEGNWSIAGSLVGQFNLERDANTRSGPLSGAWVGSYQYGKETGQEPVKFTMLLVHDRQGVSGMIKETNTFGHKGEPWLHADIRGTFDPKTNQLTFVKTYDGTGGEIHDVDYVGTISKDAKKLGGTWNINDNLTGSFTMERVPLNANTLSQLK